MDDILLNKMAIIERCLNRIAEEYVGHEEELLTNYSRQDAIILNIQRACQACIDMGNHPYSAQIPNRSRSPRGF